MGIDAEVQRAVDALAIAVFADGLADRQHMPFIETALERVATVPGRAERDALRRHRGISAQVGIGGEQLRHIDQQRLWCRLAGERTDRGAHAWVCRSRR